MQIFLVRYGKNRKLLQSKIKILECDWSENKNISENADFFVKLGKEYKITPIRHKNFRV
jgi:hypothetical protein